MAGGTKALTDLLIPEKPLQYVYDDPSLMINQFTTTNFDTMYASLKEVLQDSDKKEAFRDIVRLKDLVSEWIWYLLGGRSYSTL
jgi:hypothetical protein